jgi:group I intron endonuclease
MDPYFHGRKVYHKFVTKYAIFIPDPDATAVVYALRNKTNGKLYIGSTIEFYTRIRTHVWSLEAGRHPNRHLQSAWSMYGSGGFEVVVLEKWDPEDPDGLREREDWWLQQHQSFRRERGYNLNQSALGTVGKLSDETRALLSCLRTGHQPSDDTKRRIGEAHRGRPKSDDHCEALKKAWNRTPEQLSVASQKASQTSKGRINIKRYVCISPDGEEYVTDRGLTVFCEEHGLSAPNLHKVLKGERPHHRGWRIRECP